MSHLHQLREHERRSLTPIEAAVLGLRDCNRSYAYIGQAFGFSRQRAEQVHKQAIEKLSDRGEVI